MHSLRSSMATLSESLLITLPFLLVFPSTPAARPSLFACSTILSSHSDILALQWRTDVSSSPPPPATLQLWALPLQSGDTDANPSFSKR